MRPLAVLFDLDGTLLDTAPDLAGALNHVRSEDGLDALPYALVRPCISRGSHALMRLGYTLAADTPAYETRRQRLLAWYRAHIAEQTALFPGMDDVLLTLERNGQPWGIVTNKPGWLTQPLLAAVALNLRAACVISGDTLAHSKPHPAPILAATAELGLSPQDCLYVGDAENDALAAQAAGMRCVIAGYGYLAPDDCPAQWPMAGMIDRPSDLLAWL